MQVWISVIFHLLQVSAHLLVPHYPVVLSQCDKNVRARKLHSLYLLTWGVSCQVSMHFDIEIGILVIDPEYSDLWCVGYYQSFLDNSWVWEDIDCHQLISWKNLIAFPNDKVLDFEEVYFIIHIQVGKSFKFSNSEHFPLLDVCSELCELYFLRDKDLVCLLKSTVENVVRCKEASRLINTDENG